MIEWSVRPMKQLSGRSRYLLFPLALFYWGVQFWRNIFYAVGFFLTNRLPIPVISVGNLSVGGTGKTPMVIYLALKLEAMGKKVTIISRGYKRKTTGTLVVSDGDQMLTTWEEAGDEPYLMAKRVTSVPVVVDEVRYRGGLHAVQRFNPSVILLDDAFQHRQLERDLDIVLLNSQDTPADYKLLPYGKLREPWFHLRRANIVFWTKVNLSSESSRRSPHPEVRSKVSQAKVPVFRSKMAAAFLRDSAGKSVPLTQIKGRKAYLFCGIGDPESFRSLLQKAGADIVGFRVFEDHHHYIKVELGGIVEDAAALGAEMTITTEKDSFKTEHFLTEEDSVYSLRINFVPSTEGERALVEMLGRLW